MVMSMTRLFPRFLMILTVVVALIGGLSTGLARLGWDMSLPNRDWLMLHGALMICGFLGTLIGLERAVALAGRFPASVIVPAVNAVGTVGLLLFPQSVFPKLIITLSSAGFVGLFVVMYRLHPSRDVVIMALGAVSWLVGNVFWASGSMIYEVVHLWTAFLILTIIGERLELSRVRRLPHAAEAQLIGAVGVYLMGVFLTLIKLDLGIRILGFGAVLIAIWLLYYDIAGRTIRQKGLPRFIASCLLTGYLWLFVGGLMAIWKGAIYAGVDYAMVLHAFLLGFVFSMIFGHAPIIIPALTGLQVKYTPIFYGHLILLHVTLTYRMYGNLVLDMTARRYGGLLNVVAILLFMGVMAVTVIRSNRHEKVPTVK
jgi:hypothetical protein